MRLNSFVPRSTIIFWQIFGTLFSVLALLAYITTMGQISDSLPMGEYVSKGFVAVFLSLLFYFTWKSIYAAVVIIRYMSNATDIEISNNRFMISTLSLSVGGFFTPFVLTAMPNIPVQSTINPRIFISKTMGMIAMIGSVISIAVMFISAMTGNSALSASAAFNTDVSGYWFVVAFAIYVILFVFGAITVGMFYSNKNLSNSFEGINSTALGGLKAIATIWLAIVTVELILVISFAIVRLLGVLQDMFQNIDNSSGGFMMFLMILLAIVYIGLSAVYAYWYVKMTVATIVGIWQKDGISFDEYSSLDSARARSHGQTSAI